MREVTIKSSSEIRIVIDGDWRANMHYGEIIFEFNSNPHRIKLDTHEFYVEDGNDNWIINYDNKTCEKED